MDRIILSSKDVETLLSWRDQNKDLIRRNPVPFKGIILEFPETKITIKAYNNAGKIAFYLQINGTKAGKITGQQLPGGLFQTTKNTTKLQGDNVQSIITVYASLMTFIVYQQPDETKPTTKEIRQDQPKKPAKRLQKPKKSGITYLLKHTASGARIQPKESHASPSGVFSVRGHFRHYKDGRKVWIKPFTKGNGKQKNKTYKLK